MPTFHSRQALSDEDQYSGPRHRAIRTERARYVAGAAADDRPKADQDCRTRFVAKDDEGYLLVPDVPVGTWQHA
jgi:hypothetical protein